jgi:hypothetical protein
MLVDANYPTNLIEVLKSVQNWTENTFQENATINYTPNFMTLACANPVSRSKTFCFVRMKPTCIRFEYMGNVSDVKSTDEFSQTIKNGITAYFNQLSINKI